jgi:Tfp pilus assembly protein PilX
MNSHCKSFARGENHGRKLPMNPPKKQRGVVLFIALVALVAMSLAAVALIRSVDTNTIIAGNLAFKQAATASSDSGLESAITWLSTTSTASTAGLDADLTANGYYSTSAADAKTLAVASTTPATGSGITSGTDSSGNTIRYVVQRMCTATGAASKATCLYGAPASSTYSQAVKDATQAGALTSSGDSVMYRVTTSVAGPKNTVSFTQAFVY